MADGTAIYQGFLDRGFNPAQAAVLAGNAQQESGFDTTRWNPDEGAGGLFQWRQDRLTGLQNYAHKTGRDPADLNAQMDYVVAEMTGPEAKSAAPFLAAQDVASANAAVKKFIRWGDNSDAARLKYAQAFANAPGDVGVKSGTTLDDIFGAPAASSGSTPEVDTKASLDAIFGPEAAASEVAVPPAGLVPGTREYADWATKTVMSGKKLPQVSPPPPSTSDQPSSFADKVSAGLASAADAVPIAGPAILSGLEQGRAAVQSMLGHPMTPAQVASETDAVRAANPVESGIGTVAGTVLPFVLAPESWLLGTSGDATIYGSNLAARVAGAAGSSGVIAGADTLARGGSNEEAARNALLSAGIGGAVPLIGKGASAAFQAFKGPSAAKTLTNALTADSIAPGEVANRLAQLGPDAMVADLGPNAQQLAGGLASLPGKPQAILKNALTTRAADTGNRLTADVASTIGTGPSANKVADALSASQSAAARPLYDAVRDVQLQTTPALDFITKSPMGKAAFDQAQQMAANDGYQANGMTVGLVDYAKRALDDMASAATRAGNNNAARQATQMAASLRTEADAQAPLYAVARDAFAGPAKVKDAIEAGKSIFTSKVTPEELQAQLTNMSSSERDGLLLGAQQAVKDLMGRSRNDAVAVKQLFGSDYGKEKLALLVGPDAAQAIDDALSREGTFAATRNTVAGNSLTAARQAAQRAIAPETMGIPSTKGATFLGTLLYGLQKAREGMTAAYRAGQNEKLANMLTSGALRPGQVNRLISAGRPVVTPIAPAAAPLLLEQVPQSPNALLQLPRRPVSITVRGGNPALAGAQ